MNVENILRVNSLKDAKIIAGYSGLNRPVNGIMVLEAADIEKWGSYGQIILTSYYALQPLDDKELDLFFQKVNSIGISAIIIKIDRLVQNIPDSLTHYCNLYSIPLIQISREVKYEGVILEILGPLIDQNIALLNRYYYIHNELTALALREPSIEEFLKELKKIISMDVSIVNYNNNEIISTNSLYCQGAILSSEALPRNRYMNYEYTRKQILYSNASIQDKATALTVKIPCLYYEPYELVIHEISNKVNIEDFMVIENAVSFLQMELLKKYSLSQSQFHRKNELINDLLNGRIYNQDDIDDSLKFFEINGGTKYQLMLIQLYSDNKSSDNWAGNILRNIRNKIKIYWGHTAFLEKKERIVFINNFEDSNSSFSSDKLKLIMDSLLNKEELPSLSYHIALSSIGSKDAITRLNKEILDTQRILDLFYKNNTILSYENLGIYKLFLEAKNLDNIKSFIPSKLLTFKDEHPELLETLMCFIDNNESFSETAAKMFLHPKTIRYRIDKIIKTLEIDINNPEEKLQLQIANRLFKFIN
ncbi:PucR family transcriptional regulator [Alloiococcus sp. CFN-8]|uniref:PucR family transcriptional regulator n=1 Tax=Alloiococcus sp. CFN-8 TaxID=3416081 RepID=UPI003CF211DB